MAECDECGAYENLPYQCHRCGQTFCADHRLPENHDCPGLSAEWDDPSGVFGNSSSSGGTAGQARSSATDGLRDIWRSYFRRNVTFVVLGLMWLTFLFQFVLFPFVLGAGPRSELWAATFVLSSEHPLYVWTWITSVFSHGGFYHIAANSIGLYFFGRPVENRLGSKRFAALFLGAGAFAGLAQIGISSLVMGNPAAVLGASGGLMAVMGVLTVLNPGLRVYLWFVIPMPLWVLTFGFAAFSIFAGFGSVAGGLAHWAHLGGLAVGLAYGQRVKGELSAPQQLQFGGGRGPGGPGGPGGRF